MPALLAEWEVEALVAQIHKARAEAAAAKAEREADPTVQEAVLEVARTLKANVDAQAAEAEASRKYDERVQLAEEKEAELRARIEQGWPGDVKTIGLATMQTRRSVDLARGLPAADAFRKLDAILGATGALPKVVIGLKLDAKAALTCAETMPALKDVLVIEEKRTLAIRAPKEEA